VQERLRVRIPFKDKTLCAVDVEPLKARVKPLDQEFRQWLNPPIEPTPNKPIDPGVRIGHVHLKVANLERALDFYRDVLGFELTHRMGDSAAISYDQKLGSTAKEVEDEHDQGDYEQQMDESTTNMESKSTAPEEQEKNGDN
jgi:catechol-2,3-dioxygenase